MKLQMTMILMALAAASCNEQGPLPPAAPAAPGATAEMLPTSTPHMYSLKNADGTYDLYVGKGAKEAAEKGQPLPGGWYKLGKVRQERVDKALASKKELKVATYSLEDIANSDLDLEFDMSKPNETKTTKMRAGDPCISGVVQVAIDKTGSPTALFDVVQWVKFPNGPTGKSMWSTGVVPDEPWPALKHNGNEPPPGCK